MSDTSPIPGSVSEIRPTRRLAGHIRTATDFWHLLFFLAMLGAGLLLAVVAEETMAGIEADLSEGFERLPPDLALLIVGTAQVLLLILLIGAPVALLLARRWRTTILAGMAAAVAVGGTIAIERALLDRAPTTTQSPSSPAETFLFDEGWPPATALAGYSAAAVIVSPLLPRRWRPPIWILLATLAVLRMVTGSTPPVNIPLAIAVGGVVGTSTLLAFGRPLRVVTGDGVRYALANAQVHVTTVDEISPDGSPWRYLATTVDDEQVLVKVVGPEDWQSDRLQRTFRRLRLRGVGSRIPYSSPRRAVAVEAMLLYSARDMGARAPAVVAVAPVTGEEIVLGVDRVNSEALADLPDDLLTDEVLRDAWEQVAAIRRGRLAHGNLQLSNLRLDPEGYVWITDFEFGEPGAADEHLMGDLAELLVATSLRVGPERAVAAATGVLGTEVVAGAMSRMVPAVLTRQTRQALRGSRGGMKPLIAEVSRVSGVDPPEPVQVERFPPRTMVMTALLAAAIYVLAPQLANLPDMVEAIRSMDLTWLPAVALASLLTYIGSALAIIGGTPGRVPFPLAWMVSFASSFVATVAPPGLGNVALTVRFLQQRGFPAPVAVTASAAKETAVFLVHIVLLISCGIWVGRSDALTDQLDGINPGGWVLAIVGFAVAAIAVALSFRKVRSLIQRTVVPAVRKSIEAMDQVVRSPTKLLALFSGAAMIPIGYAVCLYASVQAFGGGSTFPAIAFVSLTAVTVASAAPTPGGIGAVEAVLLTSLTALGIPSAEALAAVFLYRIATFWVPILPGVIAFRVLQSRQII